MSLTYQPFAESKPVEELRRDLGMNLTERERAVSTLLGATLVGVAATCSGGGRGLAALLGVALLHRGWSGWCALSAALDRDTRHEARNDAAETEGNSEPALTRPAPAGPA